MTKTIGLICGSLRKNSYNRIIAGSLIDMDDSVPFRWIDSQAVSFGEGTFADRFHTVSNNNQLIVVTTNGYGTDQARIRTFERANGVWKQLLDINGKASFDQTTKKPCYSIK